MAGKLKAYYRRFDAACSAWNCDDGKDVKRTIRLGEDMMFAAADLIAELEAVLEGRKALEAGRG